MSTTLTPTQQETLRIAKNVQKDGVLYQDVDFSKDPHVLTDKTEFKIVGCRVCHRPCVVTRFATAAKVACLDHRDRKAKVNKLREFDRSKEPHVLTDKEKTKEVPCRTCGRPCIVNVFASAEKVACLDHRDSPVRKTTTIEQDGDGRYTEKTEVKVVSERDLEWQHYMQTAPWDLDIEYTDEENVEREKLRQQQVEWMAKRAVARNKRRGLELKVEDLAAGLRPSKGTKLDKETEQELRAKLEAAEKELSEVESTIQTAEDLIPKLKLRRSLTHRRAYLRTLQGAGWTLKDGVLRKGEREVVLPSDYLAEPE